MANNDLIGFLLISLEYVDSSHLCRYLILEVFWVFIWKFGEVFVTSNMLWELNYFIKLAYGKIVSLKVIVSKNISVVLSEHLMYAVK